MKKMRLTHPPMGWNSWDCYGAAVNEEQLRGNAEYMAKYLKNFGWEYVVCDIQWYEPTANSNCYHNFADLEMDEYSRLIPAVNRFPSAAHGKGFGPIADYCHSLGLKFGIHIMRGIPRQAVHRNTAILGSDKTAREIAHPFSVCSWNTDMYGVDPHRSGAQEYYNSLFELYASWGVDFVKCDDIADTKFKPHDPYSAREEIELIRNALNFCGRDMVLSLSPGPAPVSEAEHLRQNADMWRMTDDFWDDWENLHDMFSRCRAWQPYVGEGSWPDCDMLPLGRLCVNAAYCGEKGRYTNLTRPEQITMMTLWSIFRSPLFIGGELRDNDEFTLSLLTNREVIGMYKISHGAHELYRREGDTGGEIAWLSHGDGCEYLALFNTVDEQRELTFRFEGVFPHGKEKQFHELWSGERFTASGGFETEIPPHGAKLFRVV